MVSRVAGILRRHQRLNGEAAQVMDIAHKWWKLTVSQRREIRQKLGLLTDGEMGLPGQERDLLLFKRVKAAGQVDCLVEMIEATAS